MGHLDRVCASFDHYMSARNTWFRKKYGDFDKPYIAYFSTEFGITECLRNYSGAWASSAATTSRAPATSTCRWWA